MMKAPHSPHHWIPVTLVVALGLLVLSEAHGQKQDASAMYEGRPAMAGAQAGQGAMAGTAQGGIGLQGTDGAMMSVTREGATAPRTNVMGAAKDDVNVAPKKDNSLAKEERSAVKKTKKAAKRVINRKSGIIPIEGTN